MAAPTQPTQQQIAAMMAAEAKKRGISVEEFQKQVMQQQQQQRQAIEAEAAKQGITPQQYFEQLKAKIAQGHQAQQAQQAAAQRQGIPQQIPVNPGATAKPEALALAKFLRGQDLKTRQCILNGQRKDMFKVKRALRALQSPNYTKASSKNPLLPKVTDEPTARQAMTLLPTSMLALRVSKADPHAGHDHPQPKKDPKRIKGLWTVQVESQQMFDPMMHYVWLYDGPQWKQKAYAAGALLLILVVIMFPLWPIVLRQGVWYLSVGMMGLLGLFFAMAIFRLILFCVTVFAVPPGLWLFPNLFEDVGFFDSFKPVWGWQENKKKKKKAKKTAAGSQPAAVAASKPTPLQANGTARTTATPAASTEGAGVARRYQPAQVEEVDE